MIVEDRIEILSAKLLDQQRPAAESLKSLARSLNIGLGWHYLLDLSWILDCLGGTRGKYILDAGAGTGLLQWYLAGKGARVISVDRVSRADLALRFRARYRVRGLRLSDLDPASAVFRKNLASARGARRIFTALRGAAAQVVIALPKAALGEVVLYNQDLTHMPEVPDNSLDAVVSVSALEHNTPDGLQKVFVELMRVLKPGGVLLATLGAARGKDWFHEPSKGWCYTDGTLRRLFDFQKFTSSNYESYDELFTALKNCAELRDHLADFYFRSGENGMPWGKWDPQYQPVGVCKVKMAPGPSAA
jgi:SAM-dependent methyltransferase